MKPKYKKNSQDSRRNRIGDEDSLQSERCFYGENACRAILRMRPTTVRKFIYDRERKAVFADLIELARQKKVPTGEGSEAELERITESRQHQGICVFARDYFVFTPHEVLPDLRKQNLLLFLDGVGNPHNLGAILRTAAHFGIRYVMGGVDLPKLSAAAARTAEGAGEHVRLVRAGKMDSFFTDMKQEGYRVVIASLEPGSKKLQEFSLPKRTLLVLGSEVRGVSEGVRQHADFAVQIGGTGLVESLNVSVTAAIFMHEWDRQAHK